MISAVAGAIAVLLLLCLIVFCLRRRTRGQAAKAPKSEARAVAGAVTEAGTSSSKDDMSGGAGEGEKNKLVFFEGGVYSFDLEDLLRASAEVLGKGSVGTSYKAVLEEGTTVVVKRLKDVVATKREFEMRMDVLGKVKHENVVPLRAFYYSKDEKLLVSDFMASGSLSALLHGMYDCFSPSFNFHVLLSSIHSIQAWIVVTFMKIWCISLLFFFNRNSFPFFLPKRMTSGYFYPSLLASLCFT